MDCHTHATKPVPFSEWVTETRGSDALEAHWIKYRLLVRTHRGSRPGGGDDALLVGRKPRLDRRGAALEHVGRLHAGHVSS
jgi:hypothetical protein